ncbi:MAG: hypothetical protein DRQ24_12660 [Candidatus Latescibacterota bacterium]|nr:MAG: hypothetical protein DRQ24_12660 [Candidatus Latescibacterota bacterium]
MRGKIERIWENQTKDGEKYWVLSIDGKNYSVWDPAVLEGLSEGMEVEYEFRRSGKYNRITDLKKLDTSQQGPDVENPRDLKIIRMSCLRSAVEVLSGYGSELEERIEKTLEVSRRFERYVLNGE